MKPKDYTDMLASASVAPAAPASNQYANANISANVPRTLNETVVLDRAKPNLYQTSSTLSLIKLQDAPNVDHLKEQVRNDMKLQMRDHLIENLTYTRVDNRADDTLTIHARCYVFTREQLMDFARELIKNS